MAESARTLGEDHVLLCIMDRDTVTADDLLGCAVLSFRTLRFADGADPFAGAWPPGGAAARASFELPVVYSGVTMGSVSGTVALRPAGALGLDEFYKGRNLATRSGTITSVLRRALTITS